MALGMAGQEAMGGDLHWQMESAVSKWKGAMERMAG